MNGSSNKLETKREAFLSANLQVARYNLFLKTLIGEKDVFIWGATHKSDWVLSMIQSGCVKGGGKRLYR